MNNYDIFLSHSRRDRKDLHRLANDLRSFNLKVWLDEWSIKVGDPITQSIEMGIKRCKYVGVWLTNNSVSSGWVQREWQAKYAQEVSAGKVIVLPLLANECDIPELLKDKKYADFRTSYFTGLKDLLKVFDVSINDGGVKTIGSVLENIENSLQSELKTIKNSTSYLWPLLAKLRPYNRQCSGEIKETTLRKISNALKILSDSENLKYSTKYYYDLPAENDKVFLIRIDFISDLLIHLIGIICLEENLR